ncbi:hypoxia up-regulated protein [Anaeramoeba flamelloides]|uniref:Hypoxia up-regulated protein n=1 Tax=Anaeramoeba flamelloides TaxID=1746091 RepID=A0ABQ8XVT1_9EUKA|nr:hypoxia up-regulated protein [Anaeramoeba flamelloides]
MRNHKLLTLFLLFNLCFLSSQVFGTVLGIDFGANSIKVSVKEQGKPLQIALDRFGSRKIPTAIAFHNGERTFGMSASEVEVKYPLSVIKQSKELIGISTKEKYLDSDFKQNEQYSWDEEKKTVVLKIQDKDNYFETCTPTSKFHDFSSRNDKNNNNEKIDEGCYLEFTKEELIAMFFSYTQTLANNFLSDNYEQEHTGFKFLNAVISVPSYFGPIERSAVLNSAKLAKFGQVSLLNDYSALALRYTTSKLNELTAQPRRVLFFQIGASSTTVSIIEIKAANAKTVPMYNAKKRKNIYPIMKKGYIKVIAVENDRVLCGNHFDDEIFNLLVDNYTNYLKKNKKLIGTKEVELFVHKISSSIPKWKHILSINKQTVITLDGFHGWSYVLTRKEFENLIGQPLWNRVTLIIDQILLKTGINRNSIHSIELGGGSSRIPIIKKKIENYFKNTKVITRESVNLDEGVALGAGIYAISNSAQFSTPEIEITDILTHDVWIKVKKANAKNTLNNVGDDAVDAVDAVAAVDAVDTVDAVDSVDAVDTVDGDDAVDAVDGDDENHRENNQDRSNDKDNEFFIFNKFHDLPSIKKVKLQNFKNNLEIEITKNKNEKLLHVTFDNIEAILKSGNYNKNSKTLPFITLTINIDLNGIINITDSELIFDYNDNEDENNIKNNHNNEYNFIYKNKKKYLNILDLITIKRFSHFSLSSEEFENSKKKIQHYDSIEKNNKEKLQLIYKIEITIYQLFEKINQDTQGNFKKFLKENEYNQFIELLEETQESLENLDINKLKDTTVKEYKLKLFQIDTKSKIIFHRINEYYKRPEAVQSIQYIIKDSIEEIKELNQTLYYIDNDITTSFILFCEKIDAWLANSLQIQESLKDYQDPYLKTNEIEKKEKLIKDKLNFLTIKPNVKPKIYHGITTKRDLLIFKKNNPQIILNYLLIKIKWKRKKSYLLNKNLEQLSAAIEQIENEDAVLRISKQITNMEKKIKFLQLKISKLKIEIDDLKSLVYKKQKLKSDTLKIENENENDVVNNKLKSNLMHNEL